MPSLLIRRRFLLACTAASVTTLARPVPRPAPRAEGPEVGVDPALVASGLTNRWGQAMRRDLGWAARWKPLPSGELLQQLAQGGLDLGLYLGHPLAAQLAQQGLIHDRHLLARTDVLLLGPSHDAAGIRNEPNASRALSQLLAAHAAGAVLWKAPAPDSALAALVDQLTNGLASQLGAGKMPTKSKLLADVPYRLLTRADWQAEQASLDKRMGAVEQCLWWSSGLPDTPKLSLNCELAQPFRVRHPGAHLLATWLQGPLGRQAVQASAPAWRGLSG